MVPLLVLLFVVPLCPFFGFLFDLRWCFFGGVSSFVVSFLLSFLVCCSLLLCVFVVVLLCAPCWFVAINGNSHTERKGKTDRKIANKKKGHLPFTRHRGMHMGDNTIKLLLRSCSYHNI